MFVSRHRAGTLQEVQELRTHTDDKELENQNNNTDTTLIGCVRIVIYCI